MDTKEGIIFILYIYIYYNYILYIIYIYSYRYILDCIISLFLINYSLNNKNIYTLM